MRPQRIYIDTSVVGGVFDEEFAEESLRLFDLVRDGTLALVLSDVLGRDLESAPAHVRAFLGDLHPDQVETLE